MSKLRTFKYVAIASSIFLSGIAGSACLADSEASLQASTESSTQNTSQNGHVGATEAGRQAETQAGTGSQNDAQHSSSSEGTHESPNPTVTQPPLSKPAQPTANQPAPAAGAPARPATQTAPGHSTVSTEVRKVAPTAVPHARTTTYHWSGNRHSRTVARNRSYMVQTIHQASR